MRRARLRASNEFGHFHDRTEGCSLGQLVDEVTDMVVATAFHAGVVLTVKSAVKQGMCGNENFFFSNDEYFPFCNNFFSERKKKEYKRF